MSYFDVIVLKNAEQDIDEAIAWYEIQKEGLGLRFYMSVQDVLKLLKENPFLYAKVKQEFRRVLTNGFPYALFYALDDEKKKVEVVAVIHQSRNPEYIEKRLSLE